MAELTSLGELGAGFESQSGKVYRALRENIIRGIFKPGSRLVRRTIGKQYGTSAIAVAEALWRLETDGLVESEPMYGSRVYNFTLEKVRGEQLLRLALETAVSRLCAQRREKIPFEPLLKQAVAIDAVMSKTRDHRRHAEMAMHAEFHVNLARHCESEPIVETLCRVWYRRVMLFNWVNSALFPVPEDWHQRLLRAIMTGDADHAERTMREHVEFGQEHSLEVLRQFRKELEPDPGFGDAVY